MENPSLKNGKVKYCFGTRNDNFSDQYIKLLKQIHSNKFFVLEDPSQSTDDIEADAIITRISNIKIGVITADCVPILLYTNGIIAAIHAGWRGAAGGIIENTIEYLQNMGAKSITAIIGPCIRKNSYEVGQDLYDSFCTPQRKAEKFFEPLDQQKYLLDLPGYCKTVTEGMGVDEISDVNIDTFSNNEGFYSYRYAFKHGGKLQPGQRQISYVELLL